MSKYVLVETISQFRQRYLIEVPDNHAEMDYPWTAVEWAEDTVTMGQMKEFSQKWLGEVITGSREIVKDDIIKMCDEDNDYIKYWTDEQKINAFVTEIGYESDI